MRFFLYSPISIKPWSPEDSEVGIGGIETAIVETASRIAARGHEVEVYVDLKQGAEGYHRQVFWRHYQDVNFDKQGVWVVYRTPDVIPKINHKSEIWFKAEDWTYDWKSEWVDHVDRILVLCNTHVQYILKTNPELENKITLTSHGVKIDLIKEIEKKKPLRYVFDWAGCLETNQSLREFARRVFAAGHEVFLLPALAQGWDLPYAQMMDRIKVPYNKIYRVYDGGSEKGTAINKLKILKALKADRFYDDHPVNIQIAKEAGIEAIQIFPDTIIVEEIPQPARKRRNPRKLMYASSPDRGLHTLLELMPKIREVVPDVELHVFYGFNGIDDLVKDGKWPEKARMATEDLKHLIMETEGVVWRGRVTQRELYEEWLTAGMMVYPTMFAELTFIAGQEAQCCGAIPIVTNVWAQGENTKIGIKINGDPSLPLVKAQFVAEICRLAVDIEEQEGLRAKMVEESRSRCDWEKHVDQWIALAEQGPLYRKTWNCRGCGSDDLELVADLGVQAIATFFPKAEDVVPEVPLAVVECQNCNLSQLSHTVKRDFLFRGEYGYRSGLNETMRDHLKKVSEVVVHYPESVIVDIGCNDGTLMEYLPAGTRRIGFDPNSSCPVASSDPDCTFVRDFFSKEALLQQTGGKKANTIYSLAMFYDLENPTAFAKEVWDSLADNGTWVIEVQDADQLVNKWAFDFICHEHVTNWDFQQLAYFLGQNKFEIVFKDFNSINGGSILIVARKCHYVIEKEKSFLPWRTFGQMIKTKKKKFREFLDSLKPAKVWGYGASTKGNVLLQYYDLTSKDLEFIVERNPEKVGRLTPGSKIPITSEEIARLVKPDYLLALPWGFVDGFRKREPWAKFIVPFPEPKIYQPWEEEEKQRQIDAEVVNANS